MPPDRRSSLAIHVCGDAVTTGLRRRWPASRTPRDTTQRAIRICHQLGIANQHTLTGSRATAASLIDALLHACTALTSDGLFVLSFSGRAERGKGPIGSTRW